MGIICQIFITVMGAIGANLATGGDFCRPRVGQKVTWGGIMKRSWLKACRRVPLARAVGGFDRIDVVR